MRGIVRKEKNLFAVCTEIFDKFDSKIQKIRSFINPEDRIIKTCFEKGMVFHSAGDFKTANKYFTKIMTLADENSSDYRYARARFVNV